MFIASIVTAALIMSLAIHNFGWFRMETHPMNRGSAVGGLLLIVGVRADFKVLTRISGL